MIVIYKYPVDISDKYMIDMPKGAEVLTVQVQGASPFVWAKVNTDAESEQRWFCVRGTGHPLTGDEGKYIGTFQMLGGGLVWHLFEGQG